jgi:hypothetical protein
MEEVSLLRKLKKEEDLKIFPLPEEV